NGLEDYLDKEKLAQENKQSKLDQTLEAAEGAVKAAFILDAVKNENLDYVENETLEPGNIEELMMLFQARVEKDFADLKQTLEHDEKLSKELADFFKEIKDEFSDRFVVGDELTGTKNERSLALREIAFKIAKKYIHKYPYVIKAPRTRTFLTRPWSKDEITEKQNSIPVYEDGTPAALSNEELLKKLDNINIGLGPYPMASKKQNDELEILGVTKPVEVKEEKTPSFISFRNNPDKLSTGAISRPLEVVSPGKIRTENGYTQINEDSLSRLFKSFNVLKNTKSSEETTNAAVREKGPKDLVIKDPRRFFFRAFEVLDLEKAATNKSFIGRFARNDDSQRILAQNIVSQAYQMAPLLRSEYSWTKNVKKFCFTRGAGTPYSCDYEKEVTLPLLEKIVAVAYNANTGAFNSSKASTLIEETIDNAIENANQKVAIFCKASFLNYKNDPEFKQVFKASKFLRSSLKSPMGQDPKTVERIKKFDESIKKQVRTKLEAVNEDYFEPALHVLGTAAIVALGVVFIVGSGGAAAPGVVGGLFASASTFLAIEFFVSFPLVVGSLYSRINTHFIEVPAQLKFQQSLATSQVDYSKVIDWDMLRADKEEASTQRAWTIGLMPLDFFYGAMLYRHVKVETGSIGAAAFERLTGTKVKGWSAPPSGALKLPSFQEMRRERGLVSAVWTQAQRPMVKLKSYMPRYMPVPENMIRTTALRMGMIKRAQELRISAKPWELLSDIEAHTSTLKSKLHYFEEFVQAEKAMVEKIKLNRALRPGELLKHFSESAISFIPRSLWTKIKSGDVKEVGRFFTRFGDVWREMKIAQGAVVGERAKNIDSVAKKLKDFQRGVKAGNYKGDDKMRQFLETVSDNEILILEEVAKKSKGVMANFKSVFKDYQKVVHGLRPMSYLAGYPGKSFQQNAVYPQEYFDGEIIDFDYAFTSDSKDLMNFYESLMKHQGLKTQQLNELREQLEKEMGATIR
ncbi:MAG: hypothetical protein KC478_09900, partial [Bacteriovoracaceae bacterium]|nr:hypothetical protein [Bacteriovoracaceae bacterium]